jgi:hypothetical protein
MCSACGRRGVTPLALHVVRGRTPGRSAGILGDSTAGGSGAREPYAGRGGAGPAGQDFPAGQRRGAGAQKLLQGRQHGTAARNGIDQANELGDLDTADLFTEVSRGIDKWLWIVEAHLQAEG